MGIKGYTREYMGIKEYTWVLRGTHGYNGVYMGIKGYTWV